MLARMLDVFDTAPDPRTGTRTRTRAGGRSASAAAAGEELRAARQRASLSLREAAERVGITGGYLSKAENGHAVPSWDVLVRIAAAYGREPRLRLLPLKDDLATAARGMVAKTPQQRLAGQDVDPERALGRPVECGVSFVVTGEVAAVLQGLPMTVDGLSAVAGELV